MNCQYETCSSKGIYRCSRCKKSLYCCVDHQRLDWKSHKIDCSKITNEIEKRECRCMFCGKNLVLSSEQEAVNHMKECESLQEQLSSKDEFVIPSSLR